MQPLNSSSSSSSRPSSSVEAPLTLASEFSRLQRDSNRLQSYPAIQALETSRLIVQKRLEYMRAQRVILPGVAHLHIAAIAERSLPTPKTTRKRAERTPPSYPRHIIPRAPEPKRMRILSNIFNTPPPRKILLSNENDALTDEALKEMPAATLFTLYETYKNTNQPFAVKCIQMAAAKGDAQAEYEIGANYEQGIHGFEKNIINAALWMSKAVEKGYQEAISHFPWLCRTELGASDCESNEDYDIHRKKAYLGDADSQNAIGIILKFGVGGVLINDDLAMLRFEQAITHNHPQALFHYACYLEKEFRQGAVTDLKKHAEFMKKAAKQNHAGAQFKLATLFTLRNGPYVQDDIRAALWFKKAATGGHVEAQYQLADFYTKGRGHLIRSDRNAATWFLSAAEQGHEKAQFKLGMFYLEGRGGLLINRELAREWFSKAAIQGNQKAMDALETL